MNIKINVELTKPAKHEDMKLALIDGIKHFSRLEK